MVIEQVYSNQKKRKGISFMTSVKKEFEKAEIEVIIFDKNDDIKTDFSSITLGAEDPVNPPTNPPAIPWP